MDQASGLVHRRHRRGKRRRTNRRLAMRVMVSFGGLAVAWALSAGIVHVIERPVPPFKGMAHQRVQHQDAVFARGKREPSTGTASHAASSSDAVMASVAPGSRR